MWLTPNNCNNMHDCSVSTGDKYLANLVPKILSSRLFTSQKATLFIAFDEGTQNPPGDYVYAIWAGPTVARNYQSIADYSHYSFVKTLENFWGLDSLSIGDRQATPMLEFFMSHQLETKITYAPITPLTNQLVTFTATTSGGMSPFSYAWTFNNTLASAVGQSVEHAFLRAGSYNVSLSVTDAVNKVAKTFKIVTVTDLPLSLRPLLTYSPSNPVTEQNVTFTGQARGGAFPYAYNWNFGDSKKDSGEIVYHAYNSPGRYNVSLTIVDSRAKSNSTSRLVNITDVSSLSSSVNYSPATPFQGVSITFTATTTGGNQPYDYRWNLGDGSVAAGSMIHHGYSRSGTFNVTLTTTDQDANTASTPITVVVRSSSGEGTSRCWYCVWNAIPLPLPFLLIAVTSAALLVTGVEVARVRIRRK
jgi:PKD repeat protein